MLCFSIVVLLENESADFGLRDIAHVLQVLKSRQEHHSDLVFVKVVLILALAFLQNVLKKSIHLHDVDISSVELADFKKNGDVFLLERNLLHFQRVLVLWISGHLHLFNTKYSVAVHE